MGCVTKLVIVSEIFGVENMALRQSYDVSIKRNAQRIREIARNGRVLTGEAPTTS